jgi:hypothetical protein
MNADSDSTEPHDSSDLPGMIPGTPGEASGFQQTDWLSFGVTTLLVLTVYFFTLAPDVGLDNSGVWSTAAAYGGVSSPPGYPLWTLWAWPFTKLLPFSNIACRVAVSSAVAGALVCGVIALMVSRLGAAILEQTPGNRRLKPKEEKWLLGICGYVAGMVFGLNGAFWPEAVKVAVWPLSILLLSLVLCLLTAWGFQPGKRRFLYAAAFVYGLLLTNSQIELASAPAIPFLVLTVDRKISRDMFLVAGLLFLTDWYGYGPIGYEFFNHYDSGQMSIFVLSGVISLLMAAGLVISTRRAFTEWKAIAVCAVLFLLGLLLYFYLPVASMTTPPVNWAYPRTVEGFFHSLGRGQYENACLSNLDWRFLGQAGLYGWITGREFGWLYLPLCLVPFCFLRRIATGCQWLLATPAAYVCLAFLMLAVLNPYPDRQTFDLIEPYFSASYVVLAIWLGCGLVLVGTEMPRQTAATDPAGPRGSAVAFSAGTSHPQNPPD